MAKVARQRIGAHNAGGEDCLLLHLTGAEPLLTMARSAYDGKGDAVELVTSATEPSTTHST